MAFTVKLYSFSKRDNSTKRPAADAGTSFNCILKTGSGIMHPTLSFDIGLVNDPSQYNYAYIPAFERYYFIEEWYFDRALWTATLKVDVLATYKPEIGDARLYVLRAYSDHDGRVIDNLYPTKSGCTYDRDLKSNPWQSSCFIVGVVSSVANIGSLAYYCLDASELATLCTKLTDPVQIIDAAYDFDPAELSTGLQLSLVDPMQYIKQCIMLPVSYGDITNLGTGQTLNVYRFDGGTGRKVYPTSRINKSFTFTLKKHPDAADRGSYVNCKPYTNITLTIPPYGVIDIDTSVTCNADTLDVEVEVDPLTGKGILVVKCHNIVLNRIEAQIGVPISLSSVTRDYIGAASAALSGVSGAIAGAVAGSSAGPAGIAAGAIMGGGSHIGNAVESMMPRAQTIGTTGSFASNHGDFRLDYQFFRPVDDDPVHNGRPLCQMKTINTMSGYLLIQDGDVAINGTSAEDQAVRSYLEGGFYYE